MQSETKLKSFLDTKKIYNAEFFYGRNRYSADNSWKIYGSLDYKKFTQTFFTVELSLVIEFDEKNNLVMTKDEVFEIINRKPSFWSTLKDKTGLR
jgi:hypothetical protein